MSKEPRNNLSNIQVDLFKPNGGQSSGLDINRAAKDVNDIYRLGTGLGRKLKAARIKSNLQREGYDPITIAAAVDAVKAGRDIDDIIHAADQAILARAKADEIRRNPPKIHGSAAWAEQSELHSANLLNPPTLDKGAGIHLGSVQGKPLYWEGESHLLTVAPTRTGKGTTQIISNLLQYKGSAVVLDPKGELAAGTAKWRSENVGPVYLLNPFGQAPFDSYTAAFNPLDHVHSAQDATKLAEMIYPRTDDDRQRFFDNEAIGFLAGVIEFVAITAPPQLKNFGTIRDSLSSLDQRFHDLLDNMTAEGMPPSIRNAAKTVQTKTSDVAKPRLIDSLSQHLRIWDTPGLRAATERSDFDFKTLKDKPATVYLVLPFDELKTYSTFIQMVFAAALDAMTQNPRKPDIPVLFVLDEFLGLEPDKRFIDAIRTHASAGVRLWFFLQDLPTLEQKYPTNYKSFLQAEVKSFFGVDDPYTAKLVSEILGDKTVAYDLPTANPSFSGSGASYSITDNVQLAGRPLLKPEEIVRVLSSNDPTVSRKAIQSIRGVPPIMADLEPWFNDPKLHERLNHEA